MQTRESSRTSSVFNYRHNNTDVITDNGVEDCGTICVLIIGICCVVLLILIAILMFVMRKNIKMFGSENNMSKNIDEKDDKEIKKIMAKFVTDNKYEFPRQKLHLGEILGQGEFGKVMLAMAKMPNGNMKPVAVKMLKDKAVATDIRDLISEYELVKDLRHRNLIRLIGICSKDGPFLMIMDYCAKGSLRSYLHLFRKLSSTSINRNKAIEAIAKKNSKKNKNAHNNNDKVKNEEATGVKSKKKHKEKSKKKNNNKHKKSISLPTFRKAMKDRHEEVDHLVSDDDDSFDGPPTTDDLISIAWQIACGMEYLGKVNLVHRDLASRNVLLTNKLVAKVSDFGLTRDTYDEGFYKKESKGRVPIKWLAIESLASKIYNSQSDVWSFGIVLWELVTYAMSPYPGVNSTKLLEQLQNGYRMEKPHGCPDNIYKLMCDCWLEKPSDRPTFKILVNILADMLRPPNMSNTDLEQTLGRDTIEKSEIEQQEVHAEQQEHAQNRIFQIDQSIKTSEQLRLEPLPAATFLGSNAISDPPKIEGKVPIADNVKVLHPLYVQDAAKQLITVPSLKQNQSHFQSPSQFEPVLDVNIPDVKTTPGTRSSAESDEDDYSDDSYGEDDEIDINSKKILEDATAGSNVVHYAYTLSENIPTILVEKIATPFLYRDFVPSADRSVSENRKRSNRNKNIGSPQIIIDDRHIPFNHQVIEYQNQSEQGKREMDLVKDSDKIQSKTEVIFSMNEKVEPPNKFNFDSS